MRKVYALLFSSALLLSSCQTLTKTARTAEIGSSLHSATVVDIVPATEHRVTYTLEPSEALRRGGVNNVKQAAESEALAKYGNADVLLEPQYVITKQQGLLRSKVTSVTVSGRPAYYTNFRALHDSVWCNPAFRGVYQPTALPIAAHKSPLAGLRKPKYSSQSSDVFTRGFTKGVSTFLGAEDGSFAFAAMANVGYQFNPYLEVGAGIGLDLYEFELDDIPLYAYARVNLSKSERHLFLDAKYGGDLYDMGSMMGLGLGYCFGKFDLAFQVLNYAYDNYSYYGGYYTYYETEYGISLNFRF